MLFRLIRNGFNVNTLMMIAATFFVVFIANPVHEFSHAFVADKLGDDTARKKGRLTLDPLAHIDIMGALMILLCGFGYAKPVPINPRNFKNPKAGMAISAAAGPLSNLIMALICVLCSVGTYIAFLKTLNSVAEVTTIFFYCAAYINVCLAIFNLIPVMPLDGSRLLNVFLPSKTYFQIMQYERYIVIGLFVVMMTGIFDKPFSFVCSAVLKLFAKLASLPFGVYGDAYLHTFF